MNIGQDALMGLAIGDALGVPVEFKSRADLITTPVVDMIGHGTHDQPIGTWSDDSSLVFCLADSLAYKGYDLIDVASNILAWFNDGFWTAHGKVFDIGGQTRSSIDELTAVFKRKNFDLLNLRESNNEYANGNGALMRILPLVFYTYNLKIEEKFKVTKAVAELTHGHIRSSIACFIYLVFVEEIIEGASKQEAYLNTKKIVADFFKRVAIPPKEQQKFMRILEMNIASFERDEIRSDGYVVHSLEASFWCLMNYDNYKDTVLAAVNLGEDTDTTAAIAGGLAGLLYGVEDIPKDWKKKLIKRKEIEQLGDDLFRKYFK